MIRTSENLRVLLIWTLSKTMGVPIWPTIGAFICLEATIAGAKRTNPLWITPLISLLLFMIWSRPKRNFSLPFAKTVLWPKKNLLLRFATTVLFLQNIWRSPNELLTVPIFSFLAGLTFNFPIFHVAVGTIFVHNLVLNFAKIKLATLLSCLGLAAIIFETQLPIWPILISYVLLQNVSVSFGTSLIQILRIPFSIKQEIINLSMLFIFPYVLLVVSNFCNFLWLVFTVFPLETTPVVMGQYLLNLMSILFGK